MIPLSAETRLRLEALFPDADRAEAAKILEERCADGLPLTNPNDPEFMDRIRFAVLKLSAGDLKNLRTAVDVANVDWRDSLCAAGFAQSVTAHRRWFPGRG